jgi:type IV pilus assembly protein PilM
LKLIHQLLGRRNEVFGLDIGTSRVKAVKLMRDEAGYTVTGSGLTEIAQSDTAGDTETINVVRAIRTCMRAAEIRTRYAVCGVCGPEVAVRCFSFPPLAEQEINNALLFEADQVCPFDTRRCVVDYQLLGDSGQPDKSTAKTCGVFVAATPELVSHKCQLVRSASLSCVLMDVDGLALLNCLLGCEGLQVGRTIAILNVGGSYTNLAILRGGGSPFVRDLPYAGEKIVSTVAEATGLHRQQVKEHLFGAPGEPTAADLFSSLKKACSRLVSDVAETLRYYLAREGSPVEKIYLCGGFATAAGLTSLLVDQLPAEVVLWNPFSTMRCEAEPGQAEELQRAGPALAVAAGLAMRTI